MNLDVDWFYRRGARVLFRIMDRVMNGLNSICDRVFVKGLAGTLGWFSRDSLSRLTLLVLVSIWILGGVRGERLEIKKNRIYADILNGTLPVGIGAGLAAVFILLVFLLI